ncbi:MAG: aminoglycoside phosphotransferase family protein [Bowdeniella nasicola]|nr:aminoglycoside phosphotransferase family protein [Bowdeniella nasicola]
MVSITPLDITRAFAISGIPVTSQPYGNGHINLTYRVGTDSGATYLLQRINTEIFHDPAALMTNIVQVTTHLAAKVAARAGEVSREVLTVVETTTGESCYQADDGSYWRVYNFVSDAISYDAAPSAQILAESGRAFGQFQRDLADFPAENLTETIADFHNTRVRRTNFEAAVDADRARRAAAVAKEIDHYRGYHHLAELFTGADSLPLRVTHNDTKLNNVLFDRYSNRAICIVDLDTVMPGLAVHDFGDAIRFGAATALEDEPDPAKMTCSPTLFRAYTRGFFTGIGSSLHAREIAGLVDGAAQMTYECGMRFLTDYLEGDHYFRTGRPNHNLDRARTQLALLDSIWAQREQLTEIVMSCARQLSGENCR